MSRITKSKTTLQICIGVLSQCTKKLRVYEDAVKMAVDALKSINDLDGKELILGNMNALIRVLNPIFQKSKELTRLVSGCVMAKLGTSDEEISMTHLEIIKSGVLLERYETTKDLEGVDEVTLELHKISWLYHRCSAERLYDARFRVVDKSQSNKKPKVAEK